MVISFIPFRSGVPSSFVTFSQKPLLMFAAFVFALLVPHICLFAKNRGCFGAETLLGVSVGFWMINMSCYYLNKKTKSIWPGTITAAVLMTWMCIFATGMNF